LNVVVVAHELAVSHDLTFLGETMVLPIAGLVEFVQGASFRVTFISEATQSPDVPGEDLVLLLVVL